MPEDNTADQPISGHPAPSDNSHPRPDGICPKCQRVSTCRRQEVEGGPIWYCVRFDVTVSE